MKTIRQLLIEIIEDTHYSNRECHQISEVLEILDKRGEASLLVTTEKELYLRAGYAP